MTKVMNFEIEKTGFPVNIGEVELWFDSSIENLTKLSGIDELAKKELIRIRKKYKDVKLSKMPKDFSELDPKVVNTAFKINKDFVKFQIDLIFGKGAFNKVYKVHPDVEAINNVLTKMSEVITKKIQEEGITT